MYKILRNEFENMIRFDGFVVCLDFNIRIIVYFYKYIKGILNVYLIFVEYRKMLEILK